MNIHRNNIFLSISNKQSQLGLTLIELMISVSLSLFILLCGIRLFLFFHQTSQYHRAISGIQENGRYAVNTLNEDIRTAGYFGCARSEDISMINDTQNKHLLSSDSIIKGYSASKLDSSLASVKSKIKPGTDAIVVEEAGHHAARIIHYSNAERMLEIRGGDLFKKGDDILLSDCKRVELTQVDNVRGKASDQKIILKHKLHDTFAKNAYANHLHEVVYYIDKNAVLHRKDLLASAHINDEFIKDIEDMRIRYGIDALHKGHVAQYIVANQVNNWSNVVSVQISLLLDSPERVAKASPKYQFLGEWHTVTDHRIHKEWDTYIALRQRVLGKS